VSHRNTAHGAVVRQTMVGVDDTCFVDMGCLVIIPTISLGHLIHDSLTGVPVPGWQLPIVVHVRLLDVRRRWPLLGLGRLQRAGETEIKDVLIRTVG